MSNDIYVFEKPIKIDNDNEVSEIDLKKINDLQYKDVVKLKAFAITNSLKAINNNEGNTNKMTIEYNLVYDNHKIKLIGKLKDKEVTAEISVETFVSEFVKGISNNKVCFSDFECIKNATNLCADKFKNEALENNIILLGDELNYRVNIYDNNKKLIGIANRLICYSNNKMILGEAILFELKDLVNVNFTLELILSNNEYIKLTNINEYSSIGSSIKYIELDTNNALIKKDFDNNLRNIDPIKCNNLSIPISSRDINSMHNSLSNLNNPSELNKYYRLNKKANVVIIDINKYMIN